MRSLLLVLMTALLFLLPVRGGEFLLMTEDYPPFNYVDKNQKIVGVCVDIVREIQRRADTKFPVKLEIWADALQKMTVTPNSALFSMAEDYAIRQKFTFVGPIAENQYCFFAAKDKDIKITTLEDAKEYKIGVFQNDICHQFLLSQGFTNLYVIDSEARHLPMLLEGKFDLWLTGRMKAYYSAAEQQIATDKFKMLMVAFTSQLNIGFNSQTDPKIIASWTKALKSMKDDKKHAEIIREWADRLTGVTAEPTK